jgi:hypothetical protein
VTWPFVRSKRITDSLKSIAGDKAAKAIEGMSLFPMTTAPDPKRFASPPHLPPDPTVLSVVSEEEMIQQLLAGDPDPKQAVDYVTTGLRLQVKTLALAYTKLQSDMNALRMQQAKNENFTQTMGDDFKFTKFINENFRNQVMNHPELKTLDIAQLVIQELRAK